MPVTDHANLYAPYEVITNPALLEGSYQLVKAALSDLDNIILLKQVPPTNAEHPVTHTDWWLHLLKMAEDNPLRTFSSDLFHLPTFKDHFKKEIKESEDSLVLVIHPNETNSVSYKNLEMVSNLPALFLIKNGLNLLGDPSLGLPPLVTYRAKYPNFTGYIVTKDFKLKAGKSYRSPNVAHHSRTLAQLEVIDEMEQEFSRMDNLSPTQASFLSAVPRIKAILKENLERKFNVNTVLVEKILSEASEEVVKQASEEQQRKKMLRHAAAQLAQELNAPIRASASKEFELKKKMLGETVEHVSKKVIKERLHKIKQAVLRPDNFGAANQDPLSLTVEEAPLRVKYKPLKKVKEPKVVKKAPPRKPRSLRSSSLNRPAPKFIPPKTIMETPEDAERATD